MTTFRPTGIRRLIAVLLLLFAAASAHALEQMQNASFTSSFSGWTIATSTTGLTNFNFLGQLSPVTSPFISPLDQNSGHESQQSFIIAAQNIDNKVQSGYATLSQSLPYFDGSVRALEHPANAEINLYYKVYSSGDSTWSALFSIDVFCPKSNTSIIDYTYYNYSNQSAATTTSWISAATMTALLEAGASYAMQLHYSVTLPTGNATPRYMGIWVDEVSLNISPQGLVATETSDGRVQLTWSASTCPPNVPPLSTATHSYRIYRRTLPGDSWSFASSTSSLNWSEEPTADTLYYCITDVDTAGRESPKSVEAVFHRPRLRIASIDAPTSVGRGQTGIPVNMYLWNDGEATGYFGGASLTFSTKEGNTPSYGKYNWSLLSPAIGTPIPTDASITVEFSVDVLETSECNEDTIDATASETRDVGSCSVGDTDSDPPKATWMIRPMASLYVSNITVPSVVYRAQKSVPIDITVANGGGTNAQGYWDSSTLVFSQGTYENIVAPSSLPVTVSSGAPVTCRYYVDVDALSATGPAVIDARITYRDVNQLISIANNEGADTPGNWTVVAGVITLYRDAARTVAANSFSQGNYSIFARAEHLPPEKEHRLRWYDPNGVEVASSNPAIMTDIDGTFDDELTLTTSSPLGAWRVEGTQAFDSDTLCVSPFTVGTPPAPALTLQLPTLVTVGTSFVATLTFANIGSATILDAEPATLTWAAANTGTATWLSGPTPVRQDIPGESERTFTYTLQATTAGDFRLQASAWGFDETASTSPLVTAATVTSNICVIQPPPAISIASLSETYDLVTRDQDGLVVRMIVANTGSAAAYIDGASLTHSLTGHTQTLASPTALPVFLPGSSTTTLVFLVGVSSTANTGTNTLSGSVAGYNADIPDDRFSVTGGTAAWNVLAAYQGVLSAHSSYSPERYFFTAGQQVYAIFTGLVTNKDHHITVYGPTGAQFGSDSPSVKNSTIEHSFDTSSGATGTYRVDLVQESPTTRMTSLYFTLEKAGQLTSTLTMSPSSVTLGATFTVSLFVQNPVSGGSSLLSTQPTAPVKTGNSSGSVLLLSGPTPATATITPFAPATFTWVFSTTAHTGTGSLSLIASATGTDANTGTATTSSAVSNSVTIIHRSVRLSSDTLEFGSMACNTSKTVSTTRVENLGNAPLTNVSWQAANFEGPASATIDKSGIAFSPANGFTVAVSSTQDASASLSIPYNTPSGSYIATCGVYSDFSPTDGTQSIGEPQDGFLASVTVTDTALVVVNEDVVNLGSCAPGSSTATGTVTAFNGGNLTLTNLTLSLTTATLTNQLSFTPASFTSLATNGSILSYISTNINEEQAEGTYIATCTLSSDQATDTFQVLVLVGKLGITVSPDPLNMGTGTPSVQISNVPFTVQNTGTLSLSRLKMSKSNLTRTGGGTIPGENLTIQLPSSLSPSVTANATMSLYVAAGIPAGEYTGTQVLYEDLDNDNTYLGDPNEASDTFTIQVTVAAYGAIDVVNTTLELGSLLPGSSGQAGFLCRNIGSINLTALKWVESNLTSNAPGTLSADSYSFLAPATVVPGETFVASLAYTIPAGQTNGEYYGANFRLYNDDPANDVPDATDPQDTFAIHCRIGLNSLNISETSTQVDSSFPTQTTDPVEYSFTNDGTLVLNKPCATMTTNLTSGVNTIPKANVTMSPAVFSVMNPTQNKTGSWYVLIPAGTPVGSYTGTLTVWNDEDADGQVDAGEASDTMTISVGVSQLPSIDVTQEPLNLYYIPAGRTKTGSFEIVNTGNVDLGNLTILAVPAVLSPAGAGFSIPAPGISITSASNGYATGTVEVTVPEGQAVGVYTGTQKVYVDVNENNSYDAGTDPSTTFAVTITVGEKKISADSPVQFGTQNPGTTPTPVSFSLHNLKTLAISSGKWLAAGTGFPSSGLSFAPSAFTISPSDNLSCTVGLTIPQFQAPGPYVATHTAFEDDNGNGMIDMYEASASFQVTVIVATYPLLNIVPATLVASAVAGGEAITNIEFLIYNGGNVPFNSFTWAPSTLVMGGDTLPAPSLESIVPSMLDPGEYGTGTISIAPIDVEQHPGPYVGNQQLYDTVYQPLFAAAADSVDLTFIVRGPDLGYASTYQKIATSTFSATAPENRYIISGWVCPGSGSAGLGFFRADKNGYNAGFDGVVIASNSTLTRIGSPVDAGIIESQVAKNASYPDVTFTWYRVYAAFDYTFDPAVASTAWIAIKNYSPSNASYAVWFDGVQLERYTIRGQTRPAPFTTGRKVVTPGPEQSTEGGKSYFEW